MPRSTCGSLSISDGKWQSGLHGLSQGQCVNLANEIRLVFENLRAYVTNRKAFIAAWWASENTKISQSVCMNESAQIEPSPSSDTRRAEDLLADPKRVANRPRFSQADRPGDIRPRRPEDSTCNPLWRSISGVKNSILWGFPPVFTAANRYSKNRQTKWRWRQS
jgi:hypothetical protein